MNCLPADVVSIIVCYASDNVSQAFSFSRICQRWLEGFKTNETLWRQLTAIRWPQTKAAKNWYALYRQRVISEVAMRPITAKRLHPIENCEFEFQCPIMAEALTLHQDDNGGDSGLLYCDGCRQYVHVVRSQEELDALSGSRLCVMLNPGSVVPHFQLGNAVNIAVVDDDGQSAARLVRAIRCYCQEEEGDVTSVTMDPFLQITINGTIIRFYPVTITAVPPEAERKPHEDYVREKCGLSTYCTCVLRASGGLKLDDLRYYFNKLGAKGIKSAIDFGKFYSSVSNTAAAESAAAIYHDISSVFAPKYVKMGKRRAS